MVVEQDKNLLIELAKIFRRMEAEKEAKKLGMSLEEYLKHTGENPPVKRPRVGLL